MLVTLVLWYPVKYSMRFECLAIFSLSVLTSQVACEFILILSNQNNAKLSVTKRHSSSFPGSSSEVIIFLVSFYAVNSLYTILWGFISHYMLMEFFRYVCLKLWKAQGNLSRVFYYSSLCYLHRDHVLLSPFCREETVSLDNTLARKWLCLYPKHWFIAEPYLNISIYITS